MLSMIIIISVLAALYGLAWHNEPARQAVVERHATRKQHR